MPVGDQPRLTSFYNSSSSKITGTYSKKRKAESPDGTPLQPPKKGKFKENAAPQRRHLRETIEHDCIVPGEDEHIRKDTLEFSI